MYNYQNDKEKDKCIIKAKWFPPLIKTAIFFSFIILMLFVSYSDDIDNVQISKARHLGKNESWQSEYNIFNSVRIDQCKQTIKDFDYISGIQEYFSSIPDNEKPLMFRDWKTQYGYSAASNLELYYYTTWMTVYHFQNIDTGLKMSKKRNFFCSYGLEEKLTLEFDVWFQTLEFETELNFEERQIMKKEYDQQKTKFNEIWGYKKVKEFIGSIDAMLNWLEKNKNHSEFHFQLYAWKNKFAWVDWFFLTVECISEDKEEVNQKYEEKKTKFNEIWCYEKMSEFMEDIQTILDWLEENKKHHDFISNLHEWNNILTPEFADWVDWFQKKMLKMKCVLAKKEYGEMKEKYEEKQAKFNKIWQCQENLEK